MAIQMRTLFVSTLVMSSGMALAGEHGDVFSTCGTDATVQARQLSGAGIMPADALEYRLTDEQIEALNVYQHELLLSFERMVYEGDIAPHVCLHPDTDPKVAEAFEQFLNDLWFADPDPNSFILSTRWTATATNGGGLSQGDPTTLTYSFIPEGTNIQGEGPSNLISFMNNRIGAGNWEPLFQTALDAWGNISGLTYVREFNDDARTLSGGGAAGVLGVRGDVRIGGNFIDGNSGILAFNYFPNGGDMVLDTGDGNFFGNSSNNHIRLRNVVTHEAGHGIGLSHIESDSNQFLMEPFINTSFTGPQIDDIRGAQRGYGDFDENNNSAGSATQLQASPFVGGNFIVTTFRSMDDNSDFDYYSVPTGEPVTMVVSLAPSGGSYQFTAQGGGGGGSFFNANAVSDLQFSVRDSSNAALISVDDNAAGLSEFTSIELPDPGQYYVLIDNDNVNNIQTYNLTVSFTTLEVPVDCPADLTGEGDLNFLDVSAFLTAFGNEDPVADFQPDGNFNFLDVSAYLTAFGDGCP